MNAVTDLTPHTPPPTRCFRNPRREAFARAYPETPLVLSHNLRDHPLLGLDALADLAGRLPESSIEYNRGDLPIGIDGKPGHTGLSITETIHKIAEANSWAAVKNIEQDDGYRALLHDLLDELRPVIEAKTGAMLHPQGFVFISSPDAVTPYHFDPEHNILLQITGSKVMTQFPAGDSRYAPDWMHESYHLGGPRELTWRDELADGGTDFAIAPGEALFVPVMAPHYVRNGPESSISLSITWRSDWSYDEAGARCFNAILRKAGMNPAPPKRWPGSNRAKCVGFRAYRKAFGPPETTRSPGMNALSSIAPPDLRDEVNALAEADDPRRAFLRARWFEASNDPGLRTAIARDLHGRPLLALPLVAKSVGPLKIPQVAGAYWPFRGAPIDPTASVEELASGLADYAVARELGPAWRLGPAIADDPSLLLLREAAAQAGWHCLERQISSLFCLDLVALRGSGAWPSTKGKQKDRWRVRQLEKTGRVRIEAFTGLDWTAATRDAIAAIEAASWVGQLDRGGDTKFTNAKLRRYWERAGQDPIIAGMIRGHILWVGETPAAFTFGLEAGDTRYCIANNFDQQFNKFSPGRVLLYHDFEDAADRGFARIDWGLGDGGYKGPMGAHEDAPVIDLLFVRNPVVARIAAYFWQRGG